MIHIYLGLPGSGKGTISQEFVKKYNFHHLSTGDIFRELFKEETEIAKKVKTIINAGELVSDELTNEIVSEHLEKLDLKNINIIFDGYPRTLNQAKYFADYLAKRSLKVSKVIYVKTDSDLIIKRLSSRLYCPKCKRTFSTLKDTFKVNGFCDFDGTKLERREDDSPDKIRTRFKIYKDLTQPIEDFYKKQGLLFVVDNNGSSIDKLVERIKNETFE